jgi:hypothetical protein
MFSLHDDPLAVNMNNINAVLGRHLQKGEIPGPPTWYMELLVNHYSYSRSVEKALNEKGHKMERQG